MNLLQTLASIPLSNREDKLLWNLSKSSSFSVSTLQFLEQLLSPFLVFFACEAMECILTLDNLKRRGIQLANRYFLCKINCETCNHLLLWFPFTANLWSMVFGLLGISWALADSVCNEILTWKMLVSRRRQLSLVLLTIFWIIWKEMDCRAFEGKKSDSLSRVVLCIEFHNCGHSLDSFDDFGSIVNIFIDM